MTTFVYEDEASELAKYFVAKGLNPDTSVVVMVELLTRIVHTLSTTKEQRENAVGMMRSCIDELETTQ